MLAKFEFRPKASAVGKGFDQQTFLENVRTSVAQLVDLPLSSIQVAALGGSRADSASRQGNLVAVAHIPAASDSAAEQTLGILSAGDASRALALAVRDAFLVKRTVEIAHESSDAGQQAAGTIVMAATTMALLVLLGVGVARTRRRRREEVWNPSPSSHVVGSSGSSGSGAIGNRSRRVFMRDPMGRKSMLPVCDPDECIQQVDGLEDEPPNAQLQSREETNDYAKSGAKRTEDSSSSDDDSVRQTDHDHKVGRRGRNQQTLKESATTRTTINDKPSTPARSRPVYDDFD